MGRSKRRMLKIKNTSLWQCDLTLQDYLYFATVTRGSMIETGQFIHNYSLTYALGWAKSEWRQERKEPLYAEQLSNVKGIYVTPARLLTENYIIVKQRPIELEIVEGNYTASTLLNWDDMAVRPILCDVIVYALPGRLIGNARFSGTRYLRAKFASGEEEVRLPLEMGYLRKELCSSWWEENAA